MRARTIHDCLVKIHQLDVAGSTRDPVVGGPVLGGGDYWGKDTPPGRYVATAIELPGQLAAGSQEALRLARGGEIPQSVGHIVFETAVLEKAGVTLRKGDKIVEAGGFACEWHITELRPMGHYSGVATLLYAFYSDQPEGLST